MLKDKNKLMFYALALSAYLGVSISYGKIYLVHICILIGSILCLTKLCRGDIPLSKIKTAWIFLFFPLYFSLSLLWANNLGDGIVYVAQMSLGCLLSILVIIFYRPNCDFKKLVHPVALVTIGLAIFETFTQFHWPISKYSSVVQFFSKNMPVSDILTLFPSAFFWDTNKLCFVLLVLTPFLASKKYPWLRLFYLFSIGLIILRSSSRGVALVFAAFILYKIIFSLKSLIKKYKFHLVVLALFSIIISSLIYQSLDDNNRYDFMALQKDLGRQTYTITKLIDGEDIDLKRLNRREKVLYAAGSVWKKNLFFGAGAGHLSSSRIDGLPAATPHHYWLELLAHGGLFFGSVFFFWYCRAFYLIKSIPMRESMVLYFLAVPATSTLVYFFPSWLFLAVIAITVSTTFNRASIKV